jgi:hypothetical protein
VKGSYPVMRRCSRRQLQKKVPPPALSDSPHSSVLVGGVGQRRSCALGWYIPSVGVPET